MEIYSIIRISPQMNKILLTLLFFISHCIDAKNHTNESSESVNLPDIWATTIIGNLLYNADFIFTNTKTRDVLLIETYPKDFLINNNEFPSEQKSIKNLMDKFNKVNANDTYLRAHEDIVKIQLVNENDINGVVFSSHYTGLDSYNYTWLGNTQNNTILVKLISKTNLNDNKPTEIISLVKNLKLETKIKKLKSSTKLTSDFGYLFNLYPELSVMPKHYKNKTYKNMGKVFTEVDKISIYSISSFCHEDKIPHSIIYNVVLNDLGIDDVVFSSDIIHHKQKLPFTLSKYKTSKGDGYQTLSTIIESKQCQYLLAYVLEDNEPLVNNFLKFIDHFKFQDFTYDNANITPEFREYYSDTIKSFGNKHYALKNYSQSIKLYKQAYAIYPNETYLDYVLVAYNKISQFDLALNYIEENKSDFYTTNIIIWKAWFLYKLDKSNLALPIFASILDETFTSDEDFFKYIDLLVEDKQYDKALKITQKYTADISDKSRIKITLANIYTYTDKTKAKPYILALLKDQQLLFEHQYDLLDALIEIEAHDEIIQFSKSRIKQGFESAVLLNYLGDAYNSKEDYATAFKHMEKAHKMMPDNKNITSYYKSLLKKIGKTDLTLIGDPITAVEIPLEIKNKITKLKAKSKHDSYEYLYTLKAFYHQKSKQNKKTIYGKIKINNESGVAKNKTFRFGFNQEYDNAYINHLNILDSQGNLITKYDPSTAYITTDKDGINADDDKTVNIPIPALSVGVIIDYAYTIETKSTYDTQPFEDELFVSSVTNQYKAIILQGDIDNIKILASDGIIHNTISENLKYWEYNDLPNYKKTPLIPDFQEIFPWLKFSTTATNWITTGDTYLELIKKKLNSKIDPNLILSLTGESTNNIENASAIISYVQNNISYQALEFGWRSQIPNKSTTTLNNKYGDCKDHAVLLVDMLNSVNIKAKLALVNSGSDINVNLSNHNQFNHVVVYLPEINNGVFIDTTDKDSALNFLNPPLGLQGHHALVLEENNSKLIKINNHEAKNNAITIHRFIDKSDKQYFYKENIEITGYYASYLRSYLKSIELDELDSRIIGWVNNYYSDLILSDFSYKNLYNNSKPLILNFTFNQDIEFTNINLPVFIERYLLEFTQSPNRKWDFEFDKSFKITSKTTINKNSNLKFKNLNMKNDTVLVKWDINSGGKSLEFNSLVYNNRLPANQYNNLISQSKKSYKTIEHLLINPDVQKNIEQISD